MIHTIELRDYTAETVPRNQRLLLGSRGSYGIEQLHLVFGEGWKDLIVTATFHPPGTAKKPVRVLVGMDGLINVPPEATASSSLTIPGRIVFAGLAEGVQRISCNVDYMVTDHDTVEGLESTTSPSLLEQVMVQTAADRMDAKEAAALAISAAQKAQYASDMAETTASNCSTEVQHSVADARDAELKALEYLNKAKAFANQAAAGAAASNYAFGPDVDGRFSLFVKMTI